MGMKQQPKTNIQTYTIKQTHLDQVMHLSFYWEKNNDLTGFFKAFDHLSTSLRILRPENSQPTNRLGLTFFFLLLGR